MLYIRQHIWHISIYDRVRQKRIRKTTGLSVNFPNASELAQKYHDQLVAAMWETDCPLHTWDDAAAEYLKQFQDKETYKRVYSNVQWLSSKLTSQYLHRIDKACIHIILAQKEAELRGKGLSIKNSTLNKTLQVLRQVLKIAQERGWLQTIPEVKNKKEPTCRDRRLSEAQYQTIISYLKVNDPIIADAVDIALETGLRKNVLKNLRVNAIDFKEGYLYIPAQEMKSRADFYVPVSEKAFKILAERSKYSQTGYIFEQEGRPLYELNTHSYRKAIKLAGLENFTFHDLRHVWANRLREKNIPADAILALGHWQSFRMLSRYSGYPMHKLKEFLHT